MIMKHMDPAGAGHLIRQLGRHGMDTKDIYCPYNS